MGAREYLERLRTLDNRINGLQKQHDELEATLTLLGSMDYTKDRVQVSPEKGAAYERTVEKVMDSEAEIVALIDLLVDLKREAEGYIQLMEDPTEQEVLRYRYLRNLTFETIAGEMSYSLRHVFRLFEDAMASFEHCFPTGK